ncbi:hypothetical protein Scep_014811 [Stephania cephalantha]|uniref:RING-type E3 ubiquitin transferase n=1 Tax=Stephania cephalantha TaxID=152367 RepID=A0AAP0P259_9MAGN
MELYPLAVKADAFSLDHNGSEEEKPMNGIATSQMLLAVFEREKGEYRVRVQNQILCINDTKYKLQEIYGIGNSVEGDSDENQGKECVICLSEPRDTTVLPCRHMCMCNGCARHLKLQRHRCPICRQPVEQLLEIEVSNSTDE